MEFLDRMTKVIDYIEEHIEDDFDYREVASIVQCDVYQFGRIFSYVVGTSLSEYIRNRRLSMAAVDLATGKHKVIDVALKYGYNSPEAFARAFKDLHGVSPKSACLSGIKLRLYPRITFHISVKGDVDMEYRIEEKGTIKGVGTIRRFRCLSTNENGETWKTRMGERWDFWNEFLNGGMNGNM